MSITWTSDEIVTQYRKSGLIMKKATLEGDYKTNNKEGKKILKIFKYLEKNKELAATTLPLLFYDENVVARTKAAAHCLALSVCKDDAIHVLEKVANDETAGIFGFNAKMTLKVWHGEVPGKTL